MMWRHSNTASNPQLPFWWDDQQFLISIAGLPSRDPLERPPWVTLYGEYAVRSGGVV